MKMKIIARYLYKIGQTFIMKLIERDKFHMSMNKKGNFDERRQLQLHAGKVSVSLQREFLL